MNLKRRDDMSKLNIKFPYGDFPQTVQVSFVIYLDSHPSEDDYIMLLSEFND